MENRKFSYAILAFTILYSCCNVNVTAQLGGLSLDALKGLAEKLPWEGPFGKAELLKGIVTGNGELFKQYILDHEQMFQALQDFVFTVLSFDVPASVLVKEALPWALDSLQSVPSALENQALLGILKTLITEMNAHGMNPEYNLTSGNATLDRMYFMSKLLGDLDYLGMVQNVLTMRSVRDIVPYKSTDRPLNGQCYNDTMIFLDRLFAGDRWALAMLDAVGKPSPGIQRGVLYFIGNYDQCAATVARIPVNASLGEYHNSDEVTFNTRYCRSTFKLPMGLVNAVAGEHANNTYGIPLALSWGMCLPESCHAQDLEGLLNLGFLGTLFNVTLENAVCTEKPDYSEDTSSIVVTCVLGGIALIVLLCSVLELFCLKRTKHKDMEELDGVAGIPYLNHAYENNIDDVDSKTDDERYSRMPGELESEMTEMKHGTKMGVELTPVVTHRKPTKRSAEENMSVDSDRTEDALAIEKSLEESIEAKIVRSFSVFTNAPEVVSTETREDDIPCLYGIRFISMLWIMLGNTYIYAALSLADVPVSVNLMDTFDIMKRFTFQVVLSATLATDTFFMISGCLTAYWYLMKLEERSKKVDIKNWLKFYAGKYWKMTPPYMLVLAALSYLYIYLGEGPVWPKSINVGDKCHTNWWKHLLYVNNLVDVDGVSAEDQCMAWSWYLAVNMQFYLIAPILLTFISFSSTLGLILVFILAAAGIVSAGIKENMYGGDILTTRTDQGAYWNNVFAKPWCRVAAFCVGIALGYVLKNWFHKKINKLVAATLWLLSVCLAILVVYCSYSKYADDARPWTSAEAAAYEALSRPVWALCVAWVVYACSTELAGPISEFLSWKGFIPLSRLTFMVYLVHPVVMVLTTYTRRSLIYINDFEMTYIFLGHVVISYGLAFMATLIFDMPFRNIKRIINGKPLEKQMKTVL